MIIQNGYVFTEKGIFEKKDLYCKDGKISAILDSGFVNCALEKDVRIQDASGLYVVPGFVDIHTHGAMGHDFCEADPEGLLQIARHQKRHGITSFCPTSMTYPEDKLARIFQTVNDFSPSSDCAKIAGINMEGPFISNEKKGAQNPLYIQEPDISLFRRLNELCHRKIRLVTLAPELDGADAFIRELSNEVVISVGHSNADFAMANEAFSNGVSHVTHLFNAMPPLHHRDPGIIGAAADHPDVMVEVICDGIHIHPSMIRTIYRIFGAERVILISDSMEACGMPDGEYELGGQTVYKNGNHATLRNHTLAGSATNLADCFRNAVSFGIPLEDALKMVTCNPARSIGLSDTIGTIKAGANADMLLLNPDLSLNTVLSY